jgi:ribosomal protein S18 acetylase RimI-like enzyme
MTDVTVRALLEEDWDTYRQIRLAALQESPDVFVSTHAEESGFDEEFWRLRMRRSTRLLAERDGASVGVVSLGDAKPIPDDAEALARDDVAEIFGMWVEPASRGTGVAWRLVDAAAEAARREDFSHLMLWVVVENGRAVAFYSSYGFRPSDSRRPVRTDESQTEMAMVLPVRDDPGAVPNSMAR